MLTDISNRHPRIFGLVTVLAMVFVPAIFMLLAKAIFGDDFPSEKLIFAVSFALELILCFTIERFILLVIPFIVTLFGVIGCEMIYLAALVSASSSVNPSVEYSLLSMGVAVFGPEFVGIVAALIVYAVIEIIRSFVS